MHILELAKELLDDLELSRLPPESLLLKTSRLARWVGSEEVKYWLGLEMRGYNSTNPISLKYMGKTGRWKDKEELKGYWGPLAQLNAAYEVENAKLSMMTTPDTSGQFGKSILHDHRVAVAHATNFISRLGGIRSRVLSLLHAFVSEIYYEKKFDSLSESIFEQYKTDIDSKIATSCGDVLEQIPSVMARLSDGDPESISQALTTLRRIIDSFADSIYPPTDATINIGANTLSLDAKKHQNRINAFVHERVGSKSRKTKIRQNLSNLYDRVCAGVHDEVVASEARSLFLNTYLVLGEILHLDDESSKHLPGDGGGEPAQ